MIRGSGRVLGVVVGLALGVAALTLAVDEASAQTIDVSGQGQCGLALLTLPGACNDTSGGNARATGGNGGLLTTVHDVGNAQLDASNVVTVHDITVGAPSTGDINTVDATGATRPVVVSQAGSILTAGVDIFAPGGSSLGGTTGGNNNSRTPPAALEATHVPTAAMSGVASRWTLPRNRASARWPPRPAAMHPADGSSASVRPRAGVFPALGL